MDDKPFVCLVAEDLTTTLSASYEVNAIPRTGEQIVHFTSDGRSAIYEVKQVIHVLPPGTIVLVVKKTGEKV